MDSPADTPLTTSLHSDLDEAPYRQQLQGGGWPRGSRGACVTAYQGFDNHEDAVAPFPLVLVSINTERRGRALSCPLSSCSHCHQHWKNSLSAWGQVGVAASAHTLEAPGGVAVLSFSRLFRELLCFSKALSRACTVNCLLLSLSP